ncbi:enoyl-CoA hydratase/isomerase family protein [Azospirillum doebereinerae]|uniref:enoyl-CoA hydratase/isomerase family protein n=1 Tax=Azospirillum doebereinerae TaxID=92933 RepID=UPI001EE620DE|nr:enoyl-CoA hydratase/isomerase family protein [Azospirillum doebereinerae]MCG5242318.1 enoyl-CoA hydratase/isomerase family protein [Azospirillum doebereinerae]
MSLVSIEQTDGVALVRYDRGGRANALNAAAMEALTETAHRLRADTAARAVVLTGTATVFSGGLDLSDPLLWPTGGDALERHAAVERGRALCDAWAALPQLTIAAIEGPAIGGGGVLAMALDLRVFGKAAHLRLPEARLGFNLAWGGLPRLVSLVGPARAKRLLFTDLRVDSALALDWGLADLVAGDGAVVDESLRLAREAAAVPPLALRMTKRAIDAQTDQTRLAHGDSDQFLLGRLIRDAARTA